VGVRLSGHNKVWAVVLAVVVWLVAAFSLVLPHSYFLTSFGDVVQCLLLLSATIVACSNISAGERRAKFFWILIAFGLGLWLCAQLLWTYFEVLLRQDVPNPFVGDVILFLHLVPLMGALAVRPEIERDEHVTRLGTVDFLLLLVWWLYLYMFVVIPWQYVHPDETRYGRCFDQLYFAEHMVFLLLAGAVWQRSKGDWRTLYGNLFGAGLLYALSSISASVAIDRGSYYTGSFYDVPLVASIAWFAVMALGARELSFATESSKEAADHPSRWMGRLAMSAVLSLPLLAGWALFRSSAPEEVRNFRLVLTLATMLIMGLLLSLKQHRLDRELARANLELREASLTDVLTGTRNRRFLSTTIETDVRHVLRFFSPHISVQEKPNRDLIFYLIDADHFKEINDQFGHDVGDRVLIEIARRISSAIRHSDALIRWGGEEFLVVSRYTNRSEAEALAARVLMAVGTEAYELHAGQSIRRTCSIGWAAFPWFVEEPAAVHYEEVLRLADSALYQAKKAGRNQSIGMLPASSRPPSRPEKNQAVTKMPETLAVETLITFGPRVATETPAEPAPAARAAIASQDL
jgi:diguanylate cyclase (GGDEF)-like protein